MILLVLLRNDFWFWSENDFVFGFVPVTLVHQIGISLAAAGLWFLVTQYCWPEGLDDPSPNDQSEAGA